MVLDKQHRKALLNELEKATEDLSLQNRCFAGSEKAQDDLKEWWEVTVFLAERKVELIKKCLEDNELYNY